MRYDPVKDRLGQFVSKNRQLQTLFFHALDLLFLRAWYVRREVRRILQEKPQSLRPRVLDAGAGFGQYTWFVARAFPDSDILAVDIKQDYVSRARALFARTRLRERITVAYDDLTQLSASGPFDCILAVDVLEHIEDDRAVLAHFARVLRPGGFLIISTPSDQGGSDVHVEGEGGFIEEHVREGYNRAGLERKIQDAGLLVARSLYTYGPFGSFAWRLLIKLPMRALRLSWASLLLLPAYYVAVLPPSLLLHWIDMHRVNAKGTGLLLVAGKDPCPERE